MAYDPPLKAVVAVSQTGSCVGYTWEFKNGSWHNLTSAVSGYPLAVAEGGMVYDAHDGYLFLYGGWSSCRGGYLAETWTFQNNTWTRITPKVLPRVQSDFGMVYDARAGRVLLFGGYNWSGPNHSLMNETWSYRAGVWTQLHPARAPIANVAPSLAYDNATGTILDFGGFAYYGTRYNSTWEFQGGQWHKLYPSHPPSRRAYAPIVYDPIYREFVLYAGEVYLNDTWTFANGIWTNITSGLTVSPPGNPYSEFEMVWDPSAQEVVLLTGPGSETWVLR